MQCKFDVAQDKFIENVGKLCDSFGLNKFLAQLYAVLYLSEKPLSLDEIVERLSVSKGNVSINIRVLENWGAVRSVWVKGSRKDYYEANLDFKGVILKRAKTAIQKRIADASDMVNGFRDMIYAQSHAEEDKKTIAMYEERMKKIEELNSLAANALMLVDKIL